MSCRQDRLVYRRVKNFFSFADFLLITSGNVKIIFPINSLSVRPVSLLFVTKQRWPVHSFKFHLHSCKMSFEIYLGRPSPAEAQLGGKVKDLLLTKVNMKGFIYFYFIFFYYSNITSQSLAQGAALTLQAVSQPAKCFGITVTGLTHQKASWAYSGVAQSVQQPFMFRSGSPQFSR